MVATGIIGGTDSNSRFPSVATDMTNTSAPDYDVAWEQSGAYGAASIKYKYLYHQSNGTGQYPSTPITVSSSSHAFNANVSLISYANGPRFAWVCRTSLNWDPMSARACTREFDWNTEELGSINAYQQSVESATIAKSASNGEFYVGFSEKYYYPESQYNTDVNRYVRSSAMSTLRLANTTGPGVQLYDASSGGSMRLSSLHTGTPNQFLLSNTLETQKAVDPDQPLSHSRGVEIPIGAESAAYLQLGDVTVDQQPVRFTLSETVIPSDKSRQELVNTPKDPTRRATLTDEWITDLFPIKTGRYSEHSVPGRSPRHPFQTIRKARTALPYLRRMRETPESDSWCLRTSHWKAHIGSTWFRLGPHPKADRSWRPSN